jgi:hypothetical protein
LVQYLLRAVKDNGRDVVQYTLRLKELLLYYATLDKINLLLSTIPAYPLGSLGIQTAGFLLGLGYTEALYFLEASPALVDHHDTDGACPVFLLAWEHAAKVSKNPESPKSPSKNPCLSGFQVGRTLGNVKTAEVRCRQKLQEFPPSCLPDGVYRLPCSLM